jgi:hypothetical protein
MHRQVHVDVRCDWREQEGAVLGGMLVVLGMAFLMSLCWLRRKVQLYAQLEIIGFVQDINLFDV